LQHRADQYGLQPVMSEFFFFRSFTDQRDYLYADLNDLSKPFKPIGIFKKEMPMATDLRFFQNVPFQPLPCIAFMMSSMILTNIFPFPSVRFRRRLFHS
jgi:hypothetical protein